jgi:hypothetical protein
MPGLALSLRPESVPREGSGVIEHALRYARDGVHVFPCNGKIPITASGVLNATTDAKQIRAWWTAHPDATIAIAAGASRRVIFDLDRKHGIDGWQSFDQCLELYGELPATRMASTPSGGAHIYFRAPEGVTIRPSVGKLGAGIDVRAGNSYVIAPPSVIDGKPYRWSIRAICAELPPKWVEALQPPPPPKREPVTMPDFDKPSDSRVKAFCLAALRSEARSLAETPAGTRNDRLWRAAAALGGLIHFGAFDRQDVIKALDWACSQWDKRSPWKDAQTMERGLDFGTANPREWGSCAAA